MTAPLVCRRRGCGAVLDVDTDGHGRVVISCRYCARNASGLCRECPAPLSAPKRLRCDPCRANAQREAGRRYDKRRWSDPDQREATLARLRKANATPERRARKCAWMAEWRKRNPQDDIDRLIAREKQRRYRQDPTFRRKESKRKSAYVKRRRREDPTFQQVEAARVRERMRRHRAALRVARNPELHERNTTVTMQPPQSSSFAQANG